MLPVAISSTKIFCLISFTKKSEVRKETSSTKMLTNSTAPSNLKAAG